MPELEEFLQKRDYVGAITLLEFQKRSASGPDATKNRCARRPCQPQGPPIRHLPLSPQPTRTHSEWLAYCHYHNGDHRKALNIYEQLINSSTDPDPLYYLYAAACHYYMGSYREAEEVALKGPK